MSDFEVECTTSPSFNRRFVPNDQCPNCERMGLERFYRIERLPIHSCAIVRDRAVALNYPHGQLELACCSGCGFIGNALFADFDHDYQDDYEETQGFSKTFADFSGGLAQRLIDDYGLKGKTVLEIGCGKGEFLVELVERGVGHGVGFDPVFVPGRLQTDAVDRLEFHTQPFDDNTPDCAADFVCCRHTLEHIPRTLQFMRSIRRNLRNRPDARVFIEVPDATRIFRDGAFWDVYYEHCSYFDATSLGQLYQLAGFQVVDSWLDYDQQYLMMVGRPADPTEVLAGTHKPHGEPVVRATYGFQRKVTAAVQHWHDVIDARSQAGQRIAIWGSGSKCVGFLSVLGLPSEDRVGCVVDVNPYRHGKFMPGIPQPIVAPRYLEQFQPDLVIVMNPIYRPEITADLRARGLDPEVMVV